MEQELAQIDEDIVTNYPLPLALSYHRALSEEDALLKPRALLAAFESLLKYCAFIALQDSYRLRLNQPKSSPALVELMINLNASAIATLFNDTIVLFRNYWEQMIEPDLYLVLYTDFTEEAPLNLTNVELIETLLGLATKYEAEGNEDLTASECENDYYTHLSYLRALYSRLAFLSNLPLYYFHDPADEAEAIEEPSEEKLAVGEVLMGGYAIEQALADRRLPGAPFGRVAIVSTTKHIVLSLHPLLMLVEITELLPATEESNIPIGPHLIIFYDEIRGSDKEKLLRYWQLGLPQLARDISGPKLALTPQSGIFNRIASLIKLKPAVKTRAQIAQQVSKLIEKRNLPAAILEFKKIADAEPENLAITTRLAEFYLHDNQKEAAVNLFTTIAERCLAEGLVPQAILIYQRVHRLSPQDMEISLKLANICAEQDCIALSLQQCERIVTNAMEIKDYDKVIKALELAGKLHPEDSQLPQRLAQAYLAKNQKAEAIKCLLSSGERFLAQKLYNEAREAYEAVLKIKPLHQLAYALLGEIYLHLEENEKALEMLIPSCQSDPGNSALLKQLGQAYLNTNQLDEAEEVLDTLLTIDNNYDDYLLELARRFFFQGELERVGVTIDKAIHNLMSNNKERQAISILESCLGYNPNHISSIKRLIDIYLLLNDTVNLRRTLQKLVLAARTHKDLEEAKTALRQLISLEPNNPNHVNQLRELETIG